MATLRWCTCRLVQSWRFVLAISSIRFCLSWHGGVCMACSLLRKATMYREMCHFRVVRLVWLVELTCNICCFDVRSMATGGTSVCTSLQCRYVLGDNR